jgi:hypothetical protein
MRRPLLSLGLFCIVLAIDDTLLVHEAVIPGLGMSDKVLVAGYAVVGLALGWWWIRSTGDIWVRGAFFVGAAMLAGSLTVDVVVHEVIGLEDGSMLLLIEDATKLVGIMAWCFCGAWAHRDFR